MKMIGWFLLLMLVLGLPARGQSFASPPGASALIYVNDRPAVPREAVLTDGAGGLWVDADFLGLTAEEKSQLNQSGLDYKLFYQGKAYYDLRLTGSALNWQIQSRDGAWQIHTSAYHPLLTSASGGENRPSVVVNIPASGKTPTQSQQEYFSAQALPPYLYYMSAPGYYYGYYGGSGCGYYSNGYGCSYGVYGQQGFRSGGSANGGKADFKRSKANNSSRSQIGEGQKRSKTVPAAKSAKKSHKRS